MVRVERSSDGSIRLTGPVPPPSNATQGSPGIVQLASLAEAQAGVNATKAVTPAGLKSALALPSEIVFPFSSGFAPVDAGLNAVYYWGDNRKGGISGAVKSTAGNMVANVSVSIGTLPLNYRPNRNKQYASTCPTGSNHALAWVFIDSVTGLVYVRPTVLTAYVSLSVPEWRIV